LFNARSLCNKLPDLYKVLYSGCYDCIFVTESWLYPELPNGMLDPEHQFTVFRKDRPHRAGGVCVFVANKLNCCDIALRDSDNFADDEVEIAVFDVICKHRKYRFMLVYRRPLNDAGSKDAADKLCNIMSRHMNHSGPTFLLGDFNCPDIDWSFSHPPSAGYELSIYNFCDNNGFSQCVQESTRGEHTLDIVCVDEPILVSSISVQPPFASTDHDSVDFELLLPSTTESGANINTAQTSKHYLWSRVDYQAMSEYLYSVDWSQMFTTNLTPDNIWSAFCERLDEAIELFVPAVEVSSKRRAKIRHYPRHVRRLIAKKLTVWRAYKANRSDSGLKAKYRKLSDDCREAIKKHEIYVESKVIDSNNIGSFYKHVNKKLSNRSNIGALTTTNGDTASTDLDKAILLFCVYQR